MQVSEVGKCPVHLCHHGIPIQCGDPVLLVRETTWPFSLLLFLLIFLPFIVFIVTGSHSVVLPGLKQSILLPLSSKC